MKTPLLLVLLATATTAFAQSESRQPSGPPGAVKATTSILPDGTRKINIVDPDKREATETITDDAGKVLKKTWFSLDERDFTTGAVHYDAKGNIRFKESFKRDGADRITATYFYSKDDKYLGYRVFNYDSKGNVTKFDDYDVKGNLIPAKTSTTGTAKTKKGR